MQIRHNLPQFKEVLMMSIENDIAEIKRDICEIKSEIKKLKDSNSSGFFSVVKGVALVSAIDKIVHIEKIVTEIKNKR